MAGTSRICGTLGEIARSNLKINKLRWCVKINKNRKLRNYLNQAKALEESVKFIYEKDKNNIWRFGSYKTFMRKYNTLAQLVSKELEGTDLLDYYNIEEIKGSFDTVAPAQKNFFDSILANVSILRALLENELDVKSNEIESLKNFLQNNIRKAIFKEPANEYKIQDAIEQLLVGRGFSKGIDYDRETGRVKVSVKEVIPDFIFSRLDLALEVKFCKNRNKSKRLVDEINADIQSYSKGYNNLMFVIYDLGNIRDELEFKNDLDNKSNISVIIVKH